MSRTVRRFEVLLPLRFNDGHFVPEDIITETLQELEARFGAVSCETQTIRGHWRFENQSFRDENQSFRDELIRVFVDVADELDNRLFFDEYKLKLMSRFDQIDIWMTTYLIEVL